MRLPHSILCYCEGHCPDQASNGTCQAQPGGACFAAVEEMLDGETNTNILEISYGCLPPDGAGLMQCKGSLVPHMNRKAIECCTDGDICNRRLDPQVPEGTRFPGNNSPDDGPTWKENGSAAGAILAAVLCVTALAVVAIIFLMCRRRRGRKRPPSPPHPLGSDCGEFPSDLSSGSGSGLPLLVQRTIGKQINFHTSVGKGRYGEVWLGRLRGEKVAVKVFFTTEEASWFRETEIYQTVLMRHDNILGFVGADIMGTGSWTQMLLVTHYHELGSLHDYLQTSVLDTDSLLLMAHSIASGLTHLHIDIVGTKGKPAIAHRDIKSKNILVKNDGRCCIADFGLAVRYVAERNEVDIASNTRVGTRRYMAPEVLDETLNPTNFEAFKMADMYSFGLVLWEMCRRCASGDKSQYVEEYALPYHDCVPHDPSFEDMYQVVCVKQVRPQIPLRWEVDDVLSVLARIMQECWHPNPPVRLTALRVKKTLIKFDPDASIKLV